MGSLTKTINEDILGLTMLILGLFVCFWGAKFFKHLIFFVGFLIGGLFTYLILDDIWGVFRSKIDPTTRLYISLTVGALTGVLFVIVYKAAIWTCGAVSGVILFQLIWQIIVGIWGKSIDGKSWIYPFVLIFGALIGGILAFKFVKFVLKGFTAFLGSFMFSSGTAYFIQRMQNKDDSNVIAYLEFFTNRGSVGGFAKHCDAWCYVCLALWGALFICGAMVQYKLHKKHNPKDYDDDVSETDESYEDSLSRRRGYSENVRRDGQMAGRRGSHKGVRKINSVSSGGKGSNRDGNVQYI